MVQPQGPDQPQQPYGQQPYQPPQQPQYQPPQPPAQPPPQYQQPGQNQQPGQYQQPPQPYPGQYQQPGGAPAKKVGAGGCLTSVALFVLSIVAFVGLLVWGVVGTFNDVKNAPRVPLGETSTVNITQTGETYVILANFDNTSTPLPLRDPTITITDPNGRTLVMGKSSTSSGSSSGTDFRTIGSFNADVTGTYTIESESTGNTSGLTLTVTNLNLGSLGAKLLAAVGFGFVLFVAAVVVFIVWLVRRSKAKRAYA